jgi:hypothetical protein
MLPELKRPLVKKGWNPQRWLERLALIARTLGSENYSQEAWGMMRPNGLEYRPSRSRVTSPTRGMVRAIRRWVWGAASVAGSPASRAGLERCDLRTTEFQSARSRAVRIDDRRTRLSPARRIHLVRDVWTSILAFGCRQGPGSGIVRTGARADSGAVAEMEPRDARPRETCALRVGAFPSFPSRSCSGCMGDANAGDCVRNGAGHAFAEARWGASLPSRIIDSA